MGRFYPLGLTKTPREIITEAFGLEPHPLTPTLVEHGRLTKDPTICYELSKGEAYGKRIYTVLFAQVINGKSIPLRDASKPFMKKSDATDWIKLMDKAGNVS